MKSKICKDNYNRFFFKHRIKLLIKKRLQILSISSSAFYSYFSLVQKHLFFSELRNRCVFSFYSRSGPSFFRVSYFQLRQLSLNGKVCGIMKV